MIRSGLRYKQVYKITYPNRKTYIGSDLTGTINYMGSPNEELIQQDMIETDHRLHLVLVKDVLWESLNALNREVRLKEIELIRLHRSNDPLIGYNRHPPFKG